MITVENFISGLFRPVKLRASSTVYGGVGHHHAGGAQIGCFLNDPEVDVMVS